MRGGRCGGGWKGPRRHGGAGGGKLGPLAVGGDGQDGAGGADGECTLGVAGRMGEVVEFG